MSKDILIVGKMPNSKAWQAELNTDLETAGLPLDRINNTSVIPERTFENVSNRQLKAYIPRLQRIIEKVQPKYMLALGNEALLATLGHSGITKYRGRVFDAYGARVIPTISPSAAKRNPRQKPGYMADLRLFTNMVFDRMHDVPEPEYIYVDTLAKIKQVKQVLSHTKEMGFDVETVNEYYEPEGRIISFAACCITNEGEMFNFVIPLYHPQSVWKKKHRSVLRAFKDEMEAIPKAVAHNGIYDLKWMFQYGISIILTFDTMLAQHLLDENRLKGLKPMGQARLGVEPWGVDTRTLLEQNIEAVCKYNMLDSYYMMLIKQQLVEELKKNPRQARLLKLLMMPLVNELVKAEMRGIWLDVNRLNERLPFAENTLKEIETRILRAADLDFEYNMGLRPEDEEWPKDAKGKPRAVNFNASLFARWMLFDWCGLPVLARGKAKDDGRPGEPSMAEGVLMALKNEHPVISIMLERVKWQKYISSFLRPYADLYDNDHRLHTNFKPAGTVTGRLSSGKADEDKITKLRGKVRGVNLQQVPRDPFIRGLLGAPPGWLFVQSDFSQIELRIAAFVADERVMKQLYSQGADIHTITAARITGLPETQVPKEVRKKVGKPVNFGFLYGMGPTKFMSTAFENYGAVFTLDQACDARKVYFQLYPALLPWHRKQKMLVNKYGRVQSPIGRVRNLPDIYSPEEGVKAEAERQAINSPVQGFASDLAVLAMIEINHQFRAMNLPAYCLGLVHDAINYEVREDIAYIALPIIKRVMEDMGIVRRKFGVVIDLPIIADISVGRHWGDLIELSAEEVFNFDLTTFKGRMLTISKAN